MLNLFREHGLSNLGLSDRGMETLHVAWARFVIMSMVDSMELHGMIPHEN